MKKNKEKNNVLSIIVPNYNNEHFLIKSLDALINQSYKNVEIIVVNDGSKGDCDSLMKKYEYDKRIKYVKHDVNKGLFQARLTGADAATGDYIAFLDADDYISVDYYRTLMDEIISSESDMVFGNTVLEYDDGRRIINPLLKMKFKELTGKDCLNEYFKQKGLVYSWHTVWNKVYNMKLWQKARKHYDKVTKRLIMTEDFAFSTVLFYYTKKITKVENDAIFYCQHNTSSTATYDIDYNKAKNNINDLITSFNFVEEFLKEVGEYEKFKENFCLWKSAYKQQHKNIVESAERIAAESKKELFTLLNEYCLPQEEKEIRNVYHFYSIATPWNEQLENIKTQIMNPNIECVSFDIFDTLVVRPFFEPVDLFKIIDKEYFKLNKNNGTLFSKMRVDSEIVARNAQNKIDSSVEDITLEDIYKQIHETYQIDKKILDKLMHQEQELEIKFCTRRQTAYELFTLAKAMDKKVICTSDMYLPEKTINSILEKNGYKYDKLYLSSEIKKTKWTGNLYKHVLKDLKLDASKVIHIGDNYDSDYIKAKNNDINAIHFLKTTEALKNKSYSGHLSSVFTESLPFWQDNKESMKFMGIRTMLAMVANKYFDNPYCTFKQDSDFNADPYLIGYYALGMYSFGVAKWLLDNTRGVNDKLSFMARDGYLIMKAYDILSKMYPDAPKSEYIYVSRKALVPVIISNKNDLYRITDIVCYDTQSPQDMIKFLESVVEIDEEKLKKICTKEGLTFNKKFKTMEEFNKYIKIIADNFYDDVKHSEKREKLKNYFDKILGNKPSVFDVGYSGRPEYYLSNLIGKKVDTYFLNINKDEALEYSNRGGFNLKTFFCAKPTFTGNAYELLLSKSAPSCIGYDCSEDEIKPIFEKYVEHYPAYKMVNIMQEAAIEFVEDVVNIFGQDIDILYYQDYYISLPIMAYINAARDCDKSILSVVDFEDEIGIGASRNMINDMKIEFNIKNQYTLDKLFDNLGNDAMGGLNYNATVDLSKKSKISRLLFYFLFDRETLKRRIGEITYKFRSKK